MSRTPLVSVTLTTFNHQDYIAESIESIVAQTFSDWELVVVNDGSTDNTEKIALSFRDPRIKVITQPNSGPSAAANTAVKNCQGKYLAILSGDDVAKPDRLERQIATYEKGEQRLIFAASDFIDHNSNKIKDSLYETIFSFIPRPQEEVFSLFFFHGNFINALTCFGETEFFKSLGDYDTALLQLQDYDMWIRAIKKCRFEFLPYEVLSFRVRPNDGNLSAPSPEKFRRTIFERYLILKRFFENTPSDLFINSFKNHLTKANNSDPISIAYEQAQLYIKSSEHFALNFLTGIEKLQSLLNDRESASFIAKEYGFSWKEFNQLLAKTTQLLPQSH